MNEMWQGYLLEFNGVDVSYLFSEDIGFEQEFFQFVQLLLEDTADDIMTLMRLLSWVQLSGDLWPLWVASHRDEKIWKKISSTSCSHSLEPNLQ